MALYSHLVRSHNNNLLILFFTLQFREIKIFLCVFTFYFFFFLVQKHEDRASRDIHFMAQFFAPSLFCSIEQERQSGTSYSLFLLYFFVTSSLFTIINVPFMTADDFTKNTRERRNGKNKISLAWKVTAVIWLHRINAFMVEID